MRLFDVILLATTGLLIVSCSRVETKGKPCLSVDSVLSKAWRNGEKLNVCGYMKLDFENVNIYSSRTAADESNAKQCLPVDIEPEDGRLLDGFNNKWVFVSAAWKEEICPEGALCPSYCSESGLVIKSIEERRKTSR